MDLQLQGRVFLVTAASKGLGRAAATQLSREGAYVCICSRSDAIFDAAKAITAETGNPVHALKADMTDRELIERAVAAAVLEFGGLDGVVSNAGGPPPGVFEDFDASDWEAAVNLTLMSNIHLVTAALPHLKAGTNPAILAIQSMSVKHPVENLLLSNAIRMAVVGLMKGLASEYGPQGIRVNTILPGLTFTDRVENLMIARAEKNGTTPEQELEKASASIPLRRTGTVEEFGNLAAFLMSPAAGYIHGTTVAFDGGSIAAPI